MSQYIFDTHVMRECFSGISSTRLPAQVAEFATNIKIVDEQLRKRPEHMVLITGTEALLKALHSLLSLGRRTREKATRLGVQLQLVYNADESLLHMILQFAEAFAFTLSIPGWNGKRGKGGIRRRRRRGGIRKINDRTASLVNTMVQEIITPEDCPNANDMLRGLAMDLRDLPVETDKWLENLRPVLGLGGLDDFVLLMEMLSILFLNHWDNAPKFDINSYAGLALSVMDWLGTYA